MSILQVMKLFVHSIEFLDRGSDLVNVRAHSVQKHKSIPLCPQFFAKLSDASDPFDDDLGLLKIELFAKEQTFLSVFAILGISEDFRTPRVHEFARPFRLTFHAVRVVVG
jgi:hypothetical protein